MKCSEWVCYIWETTPSQPSEYVFPFLPKHECLNQNTIYQAFSLQIKKQRMCKPNTVVLDFTLCTLYFYCKRLKDNSVDEIWFTISTFRQHHWNATQFIRDGNLLNSPLPSPHGKINLCVYIYRIWDLFFFFFLFIFLRQF